MGTYGIALLIGSMFLVYMILKFKPYSLKYANKLQFVFALIILYTNIIYIICYSFGEQFENGLIFFILGSIILAFTGGKSRFLNPKLDLTKFSLHNPLSSRANIDNIKALISLIHTKELSIESETLLEGFVSYHLTQCKLPECPLTSYAELSLNNTNSRKSTRHKKTEAKTRQLMYTYIGWLFEKQVKSTNSNNSDKNRTDYLDLLEKNEISETELRINYIRFLFEVTKAQNLAISELLLIENMVRTFMEEYEIYKLKKRIEDYLNTGNSNINADSDQKIENNEGANFLIAVAFENALNNLRSNIKKVTYLHEQFWMQLEDEIPDLSRLCELGMEIVDGVQDIENAFGKIKKLYKSDSRSVMLYMQFVKEVLNDKEAYEVWGNELLDANKKAGDFAMNIDWTNTNLSESGSKFGVEDENGCLMISGKLNSLGKIIGANAGIGKLFGYQKVYLIGKHVEILIPPAFRESHKQIYEKSVKSFNTNQEVLSEAQILGLSKTGYVIPLIKSVRKVTSLTEGIIFIAMFRQDKKQSLSKTAYLILDNDTFIRNISSCIFPRNLLNFHSVYSNVRIK